jgi:predicted outer membrane lipoprotein
MMVKSSSTPPKWWVKWLLGGLFTICGSIISVLWIDSMDLRSRLRAVEVKAGRSESFQHEVLRRLDRIERKLDKIQEEK